MADADRLQTQTQFQRALRQDTIEPEGVRPVASPVDTFVDTNGGNQLSQLARSLSSVSPEVGQLSDFLDQKGKQQDQTQAQADVSKAVRNGAQTYADAVKSGAIPASASPFYRMYAQKQMGQLMAGKMASDMEADGTQAMAGATSMAAVDKYMQQYQSNWIKAHNATGDTAWTEGFNPHANAAMAELRSRASEAVGKNLEVQTQATINAENDQAIAAGMSGTQVNSATSQALRDSAEAASDTSYLNLAKGIKAGTGTLQDTDAFAQTHAYIVRSQMEADNAAHEAKVRASDDVRSTQMTLGINALDANPNADIRPMVAALTATKDFTAIESLQAHKAALQQHTEKDDSAGWTSVMEDLTGPNPTLTRAHLSAMIANGDLTPDHAHTASNMLTEQQKAAQDKSKSNSYTKDPIYSLSMKVLRSNFMSSVGGVGILNPGFGKAAESLDSQLQELITSPAYLAMDATRRRAAAAGIVQTATDNANLTTLGKSGTPNLTIKSGLEAQKAHADTSFARTMQTEIGAGGSFSPATVAEIKKRGLLTPEERSAFMRKMGLTPQPTP